MKYRKLPVEIEATQWFKNGDHPEDDCETFLASGQLDLPEGTPFQGEGRVVRYYRDPNISGQINCGYCGIKMHNHGWIDTVQGGHTVCPGDYIIKETGNIKTGYYPCKPDIFEKSHEAI